MKQQKSPWQNLHLLIPMAILISFSLTILGSIYPSVIVAQAITIGLAALVYWLTASIDYKIYGQFIWVWYGLANLLLISLFIFSSATRGSIRWLQLGVFRFQPSEIVKTLLIIFFGFMIAKFPVKSAKSLWLLLGSAVVPLILIFLQPDLGTTLILAVIIAIQFFSSRRIPKKPLLLALLAILVVSPLVWSHLQPYQQVRLQAFISPAQDPLGSGYNAIQAIISVGSGRLWGRGLGQGTQSQLQFLPERHTDFIFAAISEEFGFLGSAVIILCYCYLLGTIMKINSKIADDSGRLITLGTFCLLGIQAFINIGMNMGLVPITGVTLPLVSYGGSSMISMAILLGLSANIASHSRSPQPSLELK